MKVLELFGEPISNGGQESFVFNVLDHMDLKNVEIDALTSYSCDNEFYKNIIENKGGKVYTLELPFRPGKSRFNTFIPLIDFLKKNKYDVIHIHSGSISILALGALASYLCRVNRIIVHSHCASDKSTFKYRLTKICLSPILDFCPTDYFACSKIAGEWKFSKRIVRDKMKLINNGVDLEKFKFSTVIRKKIRKELNIKDETIVIGHVGRFSYQKNHEYLIECFLRVEKILPDSLLILIGQGENQKFIKDKVENLGLKNKVCFLDSVNNVCDYMQAFDLFLLPSHFEGLPIVGVEAQASGLTVIVSDNVSEELRITNNILFLPLEMELWVRKIVEYANQKRANPIKEIQDAGYDVNIIANELQHLYLER